MEIIHYIVTKFDGDYAILKNTDCGETEENPVALALLPDTIREGSRLRWEDFCYTLE